MFQTSAPLEKWSRSSSCRRPGGSRSPPWRRPEPPSEYVPQSRSSRTRVPAGGVVVPAAAGKAVVEAGRGVVDRRSSTRRDGHVDATSVTRREGRRGRRRPGRVEGGGVRRGGVGRPDARPRAGVRRRPLEQDAGHRRVGVAGVAATRPCRRAASRVGDAAAGATSSTLNDTWWPTTRRTCWRSTSCSRSLRPRTGSCRQWPRSRPRASRSRSARTCRSPPSTSNSCCSRRTPARARVRRGRDRGRGDGRGVVGGRGSSDRVERCRGLDAVVGAHTSRCGLRPGLHVQV